MKARGGIRDSQRPRLLRALAVALLVLAAVLLYPVNANAAASTTTLSCVGASPFSEWPYADYSACTTEGGTVTVIDLSAIEPDTLVMVCGGGSGTGVCASVGGNAQWAYAGTVAEDTLVYVGDLELGSYEYADTVAGWPGMTGGGDPEEPEETFVDFMRSGRAFAAAFLLCGLFWGMGRGIGIILGVLRR